ncbi:hypothetical protein JCM19238_5227 [Vibrio ponticus]|nr:hypothetical protein JCM19238_5227 [Vibrio ponticus]
MRLPSDANFLRLEEQVMYLADNHYLSAAGDVRSVSQRSTAKTVQRTTTKTTSTKSATMIFIPQDEELSLESKPINIEVPK